MRNRIPFALLFAALFATFATPLSAQNIEQEVSELAQKWQAAFNRADAAALGAMYTDQVISHNADGSTVTVSKADIEAGFAKDFSEYTLQTEITLRTMMAQVGGKVKVSGTYVNKGSHKKTGEAVTETGKYEHMVVQEGSVWKLCELKVMPAN